MIDQRIGMNFVALRILFLGVPLVLFACTRPAPASHTPPPPPALPPASGPLAFSSGRDGNDEIYVMNADGSGQTRLTSNRTDDRDPSWSPDGAMIAFRSDRDGDWQVYVMNADGTGQARLTTDAAPDSSPAWSAE